MIYCVEKDFPDGELNKLLDTQLTKKADSFYYRP
jgi:uncharacterized protein (DUF3820 family)